MPGGPFEIDVPAHTPPLRRAAALAARPLLNWALRLNTIRELYHRANSLRAASIDGSNRDPRAFASVALGVLDITVDSHVSADVEIPARGPLIVAANHPHGALDGLAMLDLIGRVRPDVRLIANHLLARIPELRDICFFVDPFESRDSTQRSLAGLRAAHRWLRRGGALVIFPAGEVAHARRKDGAVADSPWRSTLGRLALATNAPTLPVHIDGANSRLFSIAGRVHPVLRTVLLTRELLKRRGSTVTLRIGRPLTSTDLEAGGQTADAVTGRIREAVEATRMPPTATRQVQSDGEQPLAPAVDPAELAEDIRRLPTEAHLLATGNLHVYCAEATQIPHVLDEIGRLRERSFRAAGEGTGRPSDIDSFDATYLQLFVWNQQSREVLGAYRIGRTDLLVASAGVRGLYTRTLFRYDDKLFDRLPPALELGRSFVRPEYQRDHNTLLLLWRGICAFVQRHPRYRLLFGTVSISARYTDRTRDMLMQFLRQNHLDQQLSELVAALHPYSPTHPPTPPSAVAPEAIEEADALASQFEGGGRAMPVLLRQYLKLNARVLGFNVDPAFGDVLDALMMVDLLQVDARILRRYFGPAGARTFLDCHVSTPHAA